MIHKAYDWPKSKHAIETLDLEAWDWSTETAGLDLDLLTWKSASQVLELDSGAGTLMLEPCSLNTGFGTGRHLPQGSSWRRLRVYLCDSYTL